MSKQEKIGLAVVFVLMIAGVIYQSNVTARTLENVEHLEIACDSEGVCGFID